MPTGRRPGHGEEHDGNQRDGYGWLMRRATFARHTMRQQLTLCIHDLAVKVSAASDHREHGLSARKRIPASPMPDNVTDWLEQLGLAQYAEAFEENAIELAHLPNLDHEVLLSIGVRAAGHRMTILGAAATLGLDPGEGPTSEKKPPASVTEISGEAERRQLTVMFCDLVGSTELSQRLDLEDLREVNRTYQDACTAAIERYDGYVARYMGDGVLAYFGYPRAHEDDAERAVRAGLGIVEVMPSLNRGDLDVELAVRVGIATGPVVVGDLIGEGASQESAVVGETPNLAARLQAEADPNTVLIAAMTKTLIGEAFDHEDLGWRNLRGINRPVQVWRVTGEQASTSRFEARSPDAFTAYVGREAELAMLEHRWMQAKDGEGQVVLLSGRAGDRQVTNGDAADRGDRRPIAYANELPVLAFPRQQPVAPGHLPAPGRGAFPRHRLPR